MTAFIFFISPICCCGQLSSTLVTKEGIFFIFKKVMNQEIISTIDFSIQIYCFQVVVKAAILYSSNSI